MAIVLFIASCLLLSKLLSMLTWYCEEFEGIYNFFLSEEVSYFEFLQIWQMINLKRMLYLNVRNSQMLFW